METPHSAVYNTDSIESHTEIVVKYIIDKLVSYAVFEEYRKNIHNNINLHCYDVFTKKVVQDLVKYEFMAHDKDEFSHKVLEDYKDPNFFFDQVFYGNNNWDKIEEPVWINLLVETWESWSSSFDTHQK